MVGQLFSLSLATARSEGSTYGRRPIDSVDIRRRGALHLLDDTDR